MDSSISYVILLSKIQCPLHTLNYLIWGEQSLISVVATKENITELKDKALGCRIFF
jgi:hypothetical protein